MTTEQVANRLVELCRQGKNAEAYRELFAADAVAIEPANNPERETKGIENLLKKNDQFGAMIKEFRGQHVSDPLVQGNYFSVSMGLDFIGHDDKPVQMAEIAVYKTENGKIVKEEFFY
jgi:hypothetical protein